MFRKQRDPIFSVFLSMYLWITSQSLFRNVGQRCAACYAVVRTCARKSTQTRTHPSYQYSLYETSLSVFSSVFSIAAHIYTYISISDAENERGFLVREERKWTEARIDALRQCRGLLHNYVKAFHAIIKMHCCYCLAVCNNVHQRAFHNWIGRNPDERIYYARHELRLDILSVMKKFLSNFFYQSNKSKNKNLIKF